MDAIAAEQARRYPKSSGGWSVRVVPLREPIAGSSRTPILLLFVGTAMLFLIACADVAMLLLSRGVARHREVAVRTALGAPRWRIVRQLLMEAMIIAMVAGGVAIVFAVLAIQLAKPWLPVNRPLLAEMEMNVTVAGFAVLCAFLTAGLAGVAPALRVAQGEGLTGRDGVGITLSRQRTNLVRVFVAAEVALVVILLVGAGLLVRSVSHAWQIEPGFDRRNLLTMTVSLPENKFEWNHHAVFAREVIQSVRSLPFAGGATVIQGLPMRSGSFFGLGDVEGFVPRSEAEKPVWRIRVVSPEFFDVMRIPIVRGRGFDLRDEQGEVGYARSIVVSAAFANRYWPREDPLGKRIGSAERWETVIGVAGDVRYAGLEADPTVDVYYPQALFPQAAITLIVRTRGAPVADVAAVSARIRSVDPDAFVTDVRSMEDVVAGSQAERRGGTLLVVVFSVMALVLVLTGVYSVIAQAVVQRKREVAIRAALGAGRWSLVALAMRWVMLPAAIGITVGVLGGLAATRLMTSVLFGVTSLDLPAWVGACVIVLIACLSAGYVPARRAGDVDPMAALRIE